MRKFWKKTEGFTLVELIVVIAILGILAGVGTVGYSGYIKKANMAADETLASDIENALTLRYYGDVNGFSGLSYVVLTDKDGVLTEDAFAQAAMEAMYGSGWRTQALSYENWEPYLSASGYANSDTVLNNTYINDIGVTQLLTDVQKCTDGLTNFMATALGDAESAKTVLANKLNSDTFNTILSNANFTSDDLTGDALANATVFAVADYTTNADNQENITKYFTSDVAWVNYEIRDSETMIYDMASWYAATEAMVKSADPNGETNCTYLLNQITEMGAAGNISALNAAINALKNEVLTQAGTNEAFGAAVESYFTTTGAQDANAYITVMDTVKDSQNDYTDKSSLLDANLMTSSGMISDMNTYVAGAKLSGILADSEDANIRAVANGTYSGSSAIVYLVTDENGQLTGLVDMRDAD